jgi:hypothetical protein
MPTTASAHWLWPGNRLPPSGIGESDPLPDLEGIIVRRQILLMRCRKEILSCFGLSQIEVEGEYFLVSVANCNSAVLGDNAITVLIASDRNLILAWRAETRQDNLQRDEPRWQRHRL